MAFTEVKGMKAKNFHELVEENMKMQESQSKVVNPFLFANLRMWEQFLTDLYLDMYHYESDIIDNDNLSIIDEIIMKHGACVVVRPAKIFEDFEFYEDILIVSEFSTQFQNKRTHEPISITLNNVIDSSQKMSYDRRKGDKFEIITSFKNLRPNQTPFISVISDYAKKLYELDKSWQQNHTIMQQPITMITSFTGDNMSGLFSRSISALGRVIGFKEEQVPVNGKLFHDVDRTNRTLEYFEHQQKLIDDFGRLLGKSVVEQSAGTYQARDIQLENMSFGDFKQNMHFRNRKRGIDMVNKTFGANLQVSLNV